MFLLFLTTVQLNARIPQKLASWTLSYTVYKGGWVQVCDSVSLLERGERNESKRLNIFQNVKLVAEWWCCSSSLILYYVFFHHFVPGHALSIVPVL